MMIYSVNSCPTFSHQYPNQAVAGSPATTPSVFKGGASSSPTPRPPKAVKRPAPPRKDTKKTRKQASRAPIPRLTGPLSELTAAHEHIPIKDMSIWVNRSVETRLAENQKRENYVTRPMNSFMLYRSAYSERTKFWCAQNNHQVVSTVSGQSWPLEPRCIRDQYAEYARIERENHATANPTYRFRPHKNKKNKKGGKTRRGSSSASDDESLFSYPFSDDEEHGGSNSKGTAKKSAKGARNCNNTTITSTTRYLLPPIASSPSPFSEASATAIDSRRERSTFSVSNPHMPPPALHLAHSNGNGNGNGHGQYIQSTHKPHQAATNNKSYPSDLVFSTQKLPQSFGSNNHFEHAPLTALPGGSAGSMLLDHNDTQQHHDVFHLDPMLYDNFTNGIFSPSLEQELGFGSEANAHSMYTSGQDFANGANEEWAQVDEWAYGK